MSLKPTLTVLDALKAKIEALQWVPAAGAAEAAFQKVALFDMSDLETALQELLIFDGRVCVIVLVSEQFENGAGGGLKLIMRQLRHVSLLIADRDYGNRQNALTGSETSPGVLALKDLVLSGQVLGLLTSGAPAVSLGITVTPTQGAFVRLVDQTRENLAGRLCWEQDLELRGGYLEALLGPGPVM